MFKGAVIVMGVTSCGKTSVGEKLAGLLDAPFIEGDALHPPANIAKMSNGIALTDDDRWPWLEQIGISLRGSEAKVASCSALKKIYRQRLVEAAQRPITFVYLQGTREQLAARITARKNHFMPPSLLDSQLATLEPPTAEEGAIVCGISMSVDDITHEIFSKLVPR
jgi:gluconokinase